MLRLRKTKLLPQQVSDLGAFIFVVAMIPVTYLWEVLVVSPALFPDQQQVKTEAQKEKEEGFSNLIVLTGSWLGPAHGLWPPGGRQYCRQLWRSLAGGHLHNSHSHPLLTAGV